LSRHRLGGTLLFFLLGFNKKTQEQVIASLEDSDFFWWPHSINSTHEIAIVVWGNSVICIENGKSRIRKKVD
jgi:hypothetical protein